MKKVSKKSKQYHQIVSRKRFLRQLATKHARKRKYRRQQAGHQAGLEGKGTRHPIAAPDGIDVIQPLFKDQTCAFFEQIIQSVVLENKAIRLRFSSTTFISPSGALMLFATLDKAIKLSGRLSAITMSYPENQFVEAVLQLTGVNTLLQSSNRLSEVQLHKLSSSKKLMELKPVVSDTQVNGQAAGQLLQHFQSFASKSEISNIYGGIMEAVTNCALHAYLQEESSQDFSLLGKRWWMLIAKDPEHKIHILVCDLGIGIPVSFPMTRAAYWKEFLVSLGNQLPEETVVIQEAMKYAATRTREANRGKGLADFKKPVDNIAGSRLHVLSNRGTYIYKPNGNANGFDSRNSLGGTLIEWVIPAKEITNASME